MKTIIHLELSDEDRRDLAARIHRAPYTKVLATRKEVTEHVLDFINQEIKDGNDVQDDETDSGAVDAHPPDGGRREDRGGDHGVSDNFTPSRGDEDYLCSPKDPGLAAACTRLLDDCALIETFAWDTIERNRK